MADVPEDSFTVPSNITGKYCCVQLESVNKKASNDICGQCWNHINDTTVSIGYYKENLDTYRVPSTPLDSPSFPSLLPFPCLFPFSFMHPSPSLRSRSHLFQLEGLGEHCKLPQWDVGHSPSRNRLWCIFPLKSAICCPQF